MTNWMGRWKTPRSMARRLTDDAVEQSLKYGDEPFEPEIDLPTDLAQIWTVIGWLDRFIGAATTARAVLRNRMADALGLHGSVVLGGSHIKYGVGLDRKPLPSLDEFLKTLEPFEILAILPTSGFRVTALRKIAEQKELDVDMLNGSLYIEERKPPSVTSKPLDHDSTPQYAQEMVEGEIRRANLPKKVQPESVAPTK